MTNIEKSKSIIKGTQYKINKKDYELLIRDIAIPSKFVKEQYLILHYKVSLGMKQFGKD